MTPPADAIYLDYDQASLDRAYDQMAWATNHTDTQGRARQASAATIARLGVPQRVAYGTTEHEYFDVFRAARAAAPIVIFVHGGAWRSTDSLRYAFIAEPIVDAGAHCVLLQFTGVEHVGKNLRAVTDQIRRAVAFIYTNAASLGGDPEKIVVAGHSSGAHQTGALLVTRWCEYEVPDGVIKAAICCSGMYDLAPVALSSRRAYVDFDAATVDELSAMRHLPSIRMPVVVAYGTNESPEFQRQNRAFAEALIAQGTPARLLVGEGFNHFEMAETFGNPYGLLGRALVEAIAAVAAR